MRIQALFIKFAGQFVKQVTMRMKIRKKKKQARENEFDSFCLSLLGCLKKLLPQWILK